MHIKTTHIEGQKILNLIAGVVLLLAIPPLWPYAYYQLLRWFVLIVAGYTAFLAFKTDHIGKGWLMVAIAVLFNPIAPIYLSKGTWSFADLVVAIIFFVSANFLKDHHEQLHKEA